MSETFTTITPRDPLVARDGRPFGPGAGRRMRSTGWLTPSVTAGSFRTALAKFANKNFDPVTQDELLRVEFAGVFPLAENELLLPAPNDCVIQRLDNGSLVTHQALPQKLRGGEGCDWPDGRLLQPVVLRDTEFKPETGPAFWPVSVYVKWLLGGTVDLNHSHMVKAAVPDLRDHVSIEPESGAAEEGKLFTTAGIAAGALPRFGTGKKEDKEESKKKKTFNEKFAEVVLSARVRHLPGWQKGLETWHPLGGERRLAHWAFSSNGAEAWKCPDAVKTALATTKYVRMTLVTPAVFADGWLPPTQIGGVRLKLIGACIQRWRAISGWSFKDHGPKAIRRVVPAGGTYFFEVDNEGDAAPLERMWLEAVSNKEEDRREGFGLAVWGTWEEKN